MSKETLVYRLSPDVSLTETIVHAVADTKGVDPLDLSERLYDCIDPDALDRLFSETADGTERCGVVVFSMAGCRVEVEGGESVLVTPSNESRVETEAHA